MTNASWRVERLVEAFQSLSWPSAGRTVSWSLRCLHYFGIEGKHGSKLHGKLPDHYMWHDGLSY
uniref:Uncharacterized protein n=1 Tax=Physcomitrium patens TaxID=3218 RepID=A0A7I4A1I5_PHYPA